MQISTRFSYPLRFLNVSGRRNAICFLISIHTAQRCQVSYGFWKRFQAFTGVTSICNLVIKMVTVCVFFCLHFYFFLSFMLIQCWTETVIASILDLIFVGKILKGFTISSEFYCSLEFFFFCLFSFLLLWEIHPVKHNFSRFYFNKIFVINVYWILSNVSASFKIAFGFS